MRAFIVLVSVLATTQALGDWKEGLSVRFGLNPLGFGSSYFINVPRTVAQAKNSRWVLTPRPAGPMPSLVLYCPSQNDRSLCALFDNQNNVAGLQIALPIADFQDAVMDWKTQGFTQWTPPANSNGIVKSYWTIQQYFVSEASLEDNVTNREENTRLLNQNAVWVTGFDGKLLRVSANGADIDNTASSGFTKQACVVLMGRHYYYNMTAQTECTSRGILPWFPLVHSGELIGMGFLLFGKLNEKALVKDYFEKPDRSAVQMIVPDGPTCLYELAENPGLVTMHTYYINTPWLINCINQ
ncbi:unnamed protein product [Chilo suppressalis]|uniref:Uncharacterized protein n=1 Tax=Chilo suppressalis TaxID=168631 RepID=A0ABN8EC36_CHISP|nr:hypothetical protein evm_004507 [Chilo suppressalis]CAH0669391.1 unnamed protein product [Chilo suppressalis]